jgi:putative inorganic carbon (hco3(-)) transporter
MTVAASETTWWAPPPTTELREKPGGLIPFAALIAFSCILLLSPQNFVSALKPLRIAFLTAGLAGASWLWERWRDRKSLGLTPEMVICFLLLAWAFMTVPLSFWPGGSIARLTDVYIKSVIVFWLLANVITTERQLRILTAILMICTVPLGATALKNFMTGVFIQDMNAVARIVAYDGALTSNPNDLALMLNLILPLSIASLLSAKSTLVKSLCIGVIVVSVVAVIVTFSRAGFLGLATIVAVYFVRMIRRRGADRRWAVAVFLAILFAVPFAPSNYVDRLATVKNVASDPTGSSQARWRDMSAAAQFVIGHPIVGAGLGMDVLALNQVRGVDWVQVHNVYLEYAVDLGVPGATLFLVLFYRVFKKIRSSRKQLADLPAQRGLFLLVEALETGLIVFAICGFFYPVAYNFFFYYIGGLALGARAVTQQALSVAPVQT